MGWLTDALERVDDWITSHSSGSSAWIPFDSLDAMYDDWAERDAARTWWHRVWDFFYHTIPARCDNAKWWFLHRFHPKHRYFMVDTGLPPGYHDPDTRMTAALITEFKTFMRKYGREYAAGVLVDDYSPDDRWWQDVCREWLALDEYFRGIRISGLPEHATSLEWFPGRSYMEADIERIEACRAEELRRQGVLDDHLCRLIRIRRTMWY